jgi:hypothetical protein
LAKRDYDVAGEADKTTNFRIALTDDWQFAKIETCKYLYSVSDM